MTDTIKELKLLRENNKRNKTMKTKTKLPSKKQMILNEIEHAKGILIDKVFSKTDRVYCVVRSVSKSGMSRKIDFYAFVPTDGNPEKWYLTGTLLCQPMETPKNGI